MAQGTLVHFTLPPPRHLGHSTSKLSCITWTLNFLSPNHQLIHILKARVHLPRSSKTVILKTPGGGPSPNFKAPSRDPAPVHLCGHSPRPHSFPTLYRTLQAQGIPPESLPSRVLLILHLPECPLLCPLRNFPAILPMRVHQVGLKGLSQGFSLACYSHLCSIMISDAEPSAGSQGS